MVGKGRVGTAIADMGSNDVRLLTCDSPADSNILIDGARIPHLLCPARHMRESPARSSVMPKMSIHCAFGPALLNTQAFGRSC